MEILLKVALNTINQKNKLVLKDHAWVAKELVYQDRFYCTTNCGIWNDVGGIVSIPK
jgi:hypothetical protein